MNEDKILPKDWVIEKLGNVCFTTSGGTPSRKIASYYQGNIPWVKSGELDKGIITKTEEYISEEALENSNAKIFPKGTLLIALYGATIGKLGFLGIDAATNQAVCGIFKNEIIDLHFLKYYLFNKRNNLIEQGAGGAQPNISQTILKDLELVIPPLPEQHRIVAKIEELFSSLDKGIESLKTAQQQLKVYRQAVLKWAFEGRLTNSNTNKWNFETFKECLKFSQGFQVDVELQSEIKKSGQIRFLRIIDFTQGNEPERYIDHPGEKYFVAKDDISIVRYGASTGFVCSGKEGIIANNLFKIEPNQKINKRFLFYFLKSSFFQQFIAKNVKGAAMPAISFGLINDIVLPIPPTLEEQHRIVSEIEKRLSVADKLEESIATALQQAEALRQSILKKAFEGKLLSEAELEECRNEPNWEPASVLLERIASAKLSIKKAERGKNKSEKASKKSSQS